MDGGVPPPLPAPAAVIFTEGISLVLSRWSALEMAVMNEWGGRDSRLKAQQLSADVLTYFTRRNEPLYIDDLENILIEAMDSLNTVVDDGSIEEVAEKLMIMHEECLGGNYQSVQRLREAPRANAVAHVRQDDDDDEDDDDSDDGGGGGGDMVIDQPGPRQTPPVVTDADGWTTVSSRRNRSNRN